MRNMSNTVITNYTDLNGPSTKADSSVVVIVNKDGSLSVDQNLLGTLIGTDGSQAAGISVVRVGHEGRPDDATDSESDDDKVPHVTLSVDSYYGEPNSIMKYDSGAEMLQSLRIETRENSLVGFQNDHCYTPLTSPSQSTPQQSDHFTSYDDPVIEITHTPPPKPVPNTKKIAILDQKIIQKGKKIILNPSESSVILKGNDILHKPQNILSKSKQSQKGSEDSLESSSVSSSGDSIPDRDSDSDYKEAREKTGSVKSKRSKIKPRILKHLQSTKTSKLEQKSTPKSIKTLKREIKEKVHAKAFDKKISEITSAKSKDVSSSETPLTPNLDSLKKSTTKPLKKEKKTPARVTALLSDMSSLFSTPDIIRRVSTDNKSKSDKDATNKKMGLAQKQETNEPKVQNVEKNRSLLSTKTYSKEKKDKLSDKISKPYDPIPQLDDVSLAQILQDTTPSVAKGNPAISAATMSSPGLAGPLSPTLDLLGGLQPEEEGLTEDLLMHVAQLVESSENLQEVIDKQVLGKVDTAPPKTVVQSSPFQQAHASSTLYTTPKTIKTVLPRKDPIEIVRKDGRVITLPPIEAPATRSSKRKSQMESFSTPQAEEVPTSTIPTPVLAVTTTPPEPQVPLVSKQYINKKLTAKKLELVEQPPVIEKSAESQESWNSEDDPFRLWCICKQPHNNRFMICCDSCEDWFHGKCVNITKAMGQQMEEKGVEWRCPNCIKKTKNSAKHPAKGIEVAKKTQGEDKITSASISPISTKDTKINTNCIVCKKAARASSIYCSDSCILKHAQDSLVVHASPDKMGNESGKSQDKSKSDSRVIVYERKSGRLLAGPNAPTADNLKSWLQKNPTFEVVRPGTLSTIKPKIAKKKSFGEANKIQTTLNFDRIPKKPAGSSAEMVKNTDSKQSSFKVLLSPKEESRPAPRTPVTSRPQHYQDTPRPSTSTARISNEQRKPQRATSTRSHSAYEKTPAVSPSTSRKKDTPESKSKMNSTEPIRENVRKALQEQMCKRMEENPESKFTQDEIRQFALETEAELHDLFRDVGMKYKAKYRSLMFNIKDRKNLSLWQKICDHAITPKQLVRLSPEELASQELAQWRDKEAKYQLELIKKSELDLLAASKTYVLKTHKGEEVMETKESVSTELDPNVPVEDLVTALNDSAASELEPSTETSETPPSTKKSQDSDKSRSNKKEKDSSRSSKKNKESRRESESRKSRSSRRRSDEKETRSTRRSEKQSRIRSDSKDRSKTGSTKDKSDSSERSRHRSPSRGKAKRRSKSREHSRSTSQNRDRSQSKERNKRSHSGEKESKRKRRSQLKHSTEDKIKLRSRSQETSYTKSKNDSTDSDSIERPKSAMMKDSHPAYDPHEPMITSAFSEEDLRKSGEDLYDSYKDIGEYKDDYDSSKAFTLDTSIILPTSQYTAPKEKASEAESDQEPSSTVDHSSATVWSGCINMVDVARFYVAAHEVSGSGAEVEEDLSTELDIVGRINPETVWDYISKMKRTTNKDIVILRLQAANDEEKMQYIALYSYLSSRNRLGVVKVTHPVLVKDIYIVPLPANTALPSVLFPLDGPGIGEVKTHLLLAIIIRQRKKRAAPSIPKDVVPAKVSRERRKRSYTPPVAGEGSPASPRRRALPMPYASPALSSTVKSKIAASLAAADDEEAYSPGSSSSSGSTPAPAGDASNTTLRNKMEELNRQIEEQKQQILKMAQADSSVGEDEAYSPSRPMTPPEAVANPLADISLPSNLQEILATIKQRSEPVADVDMRNLPLPP